MVPKEIIKKVWEESTQTNYEQSVFCRFENIIIEIIDTVLERSTGEEIIVIKEFINKLGYKLDIVYIQSMSSDNESLCSISYTKKEYEFNDKKNYPRTTHWSSEIDNLRYVLGEILKESGITKHYLDKLYTKN